jgi:MFS family permease
MLSLIKSSEDTNQTKELANIILFFSGKLVSLFGSSIYAFTLSLYVLKITGSGLNFAATLVLSTLPAIVVNPFAGVLADRMNRKRLIILMDFLNGALYIVLYILSLNSLTLSIIYVSTLITTILTCIFDMSLEAAKPDIVSNERLMSLNSASKIIDSASSILGPMVGGLVFALINIKIVILINGVSFIFSAISELFMDFNLNTKQSPPAKKITFFKDIKEGFNYMILEKGILNLFYVFIILNLFLSLAISVPIPFIINNVLKLKPHYFGIIEGAFSVGMILGAAFVKKAYQKFSYNRLLKMMSFVLSLCMVMTGLILIPVIKPITKPIYFIYYGTIMAVLGAAISFIDIPLFFILQKVIPEELRGRVLSLGISIAKIVAPAALILSGFLMNHIPVFILPIVSGIALFISIIIILRNGALKGLSF